MQIAFVRRLRWICLVALAVVAALAGCRDAPACRSARRPAGRRQQHRLVPARPLVGPRRSPDRLVRRHHWGAGAALGGARDHARLRPAAGVAAQRHQRPAPPDSGRYPWRRRRRCPLRGRPARVVSGGRVGGRGLADRALRARVGPPTGACLSLVRASRSLAHAGRVSMVETLRALEVEPHQVLAPDHLAVEHLLDLVDDLLADARLIDLRRAGASAPASSRRRAWR